MPIQTSFPYPLRHTPYTRLALVYVSILITLIACDDSTSTNTIGDLEMNTDLMIDQTMSDVGNNEVADIGLDMQSVIEDLSISDMAWSFDLAIVEEEYSDQAASVDRLYAGYAQRSLGFPLGIGTVGFFPASGGFSNPFAASGTNTQHTDLSARALLIRGGAKSVVLLRTDTAAMWQDFVVDIKRELRTRGRGDLADGLIVGATHTHSSGGKIIAHPILRLLAGQFSPALYHRILSNLVEVVLEADRNILPAQVGYDTIQVDTLHSDRRCENRDIIDHSMGLLKVTNETGDLQAVVVNYAMHATVISGDDFLLSADATGAIEKGVEQRLPTYAPVLYFQSWAGDMSPEVPEEHITQEGNEPHRRYKELAAIGKEAAKQIIPALEQINVSADLDLDVKTIRFPMSNELINPDGSFDRYPYGGAYCYPLDSSNCPEDGQEQRIYTPEDLACLIAVPEADSIKWGQIAAVKLGELGMVSLPGEPLTSIGIELRDRALELTGLDQVWVLGYAQGYLGYLLHPNDYFLGGYEGSGGIWGPGLGQFLVDRGVEIIAHLIDTRRPLSFLPVPLPPQAPIPVEQIVPEEALGDPSWIEEPQQMDDEYWTAEWIGGDPAIDAPYVYLEMSQTSTNGTVEWLAVTHQSGLLWDSHGPEIELSIRVDPSYRQQSEQSGRHFYWRVRMADHFSVTPSIGELSGQFRWVVNGHSPTPYQLESIPFEINLD